jgi:hypothetical protein
MAVVESCRLDTVIVADRHPSGDVHCSGGIPMSMKLDEAVAETGTRFLLFPQPRFLEAFSEPETIYVSVSPRDILPGPADDRMYVLDAINKTPYGGSNQRPFLGQSFPPVQPGADGHFDHLDVDSREFSSATMYATVRRVLDIWQDYLGRRMEWHFDFRFERMELIPQIVWDNAQSGFGFLEFGFGRTPSGGIDPSRPYCQNFDVLAHELGHSIIFAEVGTPSLGGRTDEYGGFHESAGDLVAIVSSLHFHKVVDHLLQHSSGNLFSPNELSRVGELSESRQIRNAFNYDRLGSVTREPHDLSKPLTGAIFDVFVEVFQDNLVRGKLITQDLADRSFHEPNANVDEAAIQAEFAAAYQGKHDQFKTALFGARDYLGALLARTWTNLDRNFLTYTGVARQLLADDRVITGGQHQDKIRDCFAWREIGVSPDEPALQTWRLSDCGMR